MEQRNTQKDISVLTFIRIIMCLFIISQTKSFLLDIVQYWKITLKCCTLYIYIFYMIPSAIPNLWHRMQLFHSISLGIKQQRIGSEIMRNLYINLIA
jgi:hypothetical protein